MKIKSSTSTLKNVVLSALMLISCAPAFSDTYPSKPIRLIVPFAPGGTTDIIARAISDPVGKILGQSVIVDNKAGGGGSVGALELMRSTKDGYTIGVATVSTVASNPAINKKIGYDPIKDFQPIINIAATPNVIVVNPSFPAKDYKSFLELLKKNPGKYSYASSGTGGIGHLLTELYKNLSGTFIVHIPYRGAGPALVDTVAGQVPIMFDNLPSALNFIKEGRLVPIVVASPKRVPVLPNVPTFAEVGLATANRTAFYGIVAPAGTPKEIVDKIHAAIAKALQDPGVKKRIEDTGSVIIANTPEQFAEQIKAEYQIYKDVVKKQNLTLD